ncbi:hypothetical protein N656DRAFT_828828 [Canariomyces notabilis]|uniref:Uncharacterized protein n=1 Tax=Canariomyces notabilis TaxID=2074819 RepID=A0AAN6YU34_9PEZI|nr:hypothetical protein N656DRAFT_828828 [Canariomyces arenarius]
MIKIGYNTEHSVQKRKEMIAEAAKDRQLQNFVLLAHILKRAGMDNGEVTLCLKRYLGTLPAEDLRSLRVHLPRVQVISNDFVPTVDGIAELAEIPSMAKAYVTRALQIAGQRMVKEPKTAHGAKGWIRALLHRLAAALPQAPQQGEGSKAAWTTNPDSAIWLGIMARLRVATPVDTWDATVTNDMTFACYNGWRGVFGLPPAIPDPFAVVPATPNIPKHRSKQADFRLERRKPRFLRRDTLLRL